MRATKKASEPQKGSGARTKERERKNHKKVKKEQSRWEGNSFTLA
jgi:hypothetical protein